MKLRRSVVGIISVCLLFFGLWACGGNSTVDDSTSDVDEPAETTEVDSETQDFLFYNIKIELPASWTVDRDSSSNIVTITPDDFEGMVLISTFDDAGYSHSDDESIVKDLIGQLGINADFDSAETGYIDAANYYRMHFDDTNMEGYAEVIVTGYSPYVIVATSRPDTFKDDEKKLLAVLDSATHGDNGRLPKPMFDDPDGASDSSSGDSSASSTSDSFANMLGNLGSFDVEVIEGSGDDVIDIPCAGTPCIIMLTHTGSHNFAVKSVDSSGGPVDLLVNEIGNYSGTVTTYSDWQDSAMLEINADGPWTATFKPLSEMDKADNGSTFHGDNVVYIDEDSLTKIHFTHNGSHNFAVKAIGINDTKLLVNEIGNYDGTVLWGEPKSFFIVSADGDWSLSW